MFLVVVLCKILERRWVFRNVHRCDVLIFYSSCSRVDSFDRCVTCDVWKAEVPCLFWFVLTKLRRGDSWRFFNISFHFFGFNFILCSIENLWISLTATFSKLIPFLSGRISNAVVSSTNLILKCQPRKRLLVITANKITPSFVPCGIPPLGDFQSDREFPILQLAISQSGRP